MEEADKLCEQLFLWLEKQEQCPKQLLALAQELENLHISSSAFQTAGKTAAVSGFLAGCLPAPMAVLAAAEIDTTGQLREIINKSETLTKEVKEIGETLLNKLSVKCASQGQGASAASSDDESDECEVNTQCMGALARKDGIDVSLDVLRRFYETRVFNQKTGAQGLLITGLKSAIERTVWVAEEALLACGLVKNIEEKKNNQREASRSLQSTAGKMKEEIRNLRKMTHAPLEIIRKLSEFRTLLRDLGGYSLTVTEDGQKVLNFIKETCNDDTIISWVDENQAEFLDLFRFLRDHLLKHLEEEIKKRNRRPLHIVFVAHGSITDEFIPASVLVPTPSITDTIFYSPWNCYIDAYAASGIAEGNIEPYLREFYNIHKPDILLNYDHLPQRWNSMRQSAEPTVPQILLGPVTPDEPVWRAFMELGGYVYRGDRIIIPYLQPHSNTPDIPFYMLIFATSYIFMITRVTATVHLAACLGREETELIREECKQRCETQYGYTEDDTAMSMYIEATDENDLLLQAFRMMFGNNNRH